NHDVFHLGQWEARDVASGDDSSGQLAAWSWRDGPAFRLVVVNLGTTPAQGRGNVLGDLGDAAAFEFYDLLDGHRYVRSRDDLVPDGLDVRLAAGQSHVFDVATASGVR